MQSILSLTRILFKTNLQKFQLPKPCFFSTFQDSTLNNFLRVRSPALTQTCGFKIKGKVRRRCKSCYIVFRDERVYVICPAHPRHKQMSMKPKPINTWVLTHASQSRIRPW